VTLDPQDIERIADAVAERLDGGERTAPVRLVDAAAVAAALRVERDWVYAHAEELGGFRLGGPQGRLRFDLQNVLRELRPRPCPSAPADRPRRRRSHRRRTSPSPIELIPYDHLQ